MTTPSELEIPPALQHLIASRPDFPPTLTAALATAFQYPTHIPGLEPTNRPRAAVHWLMWPEVRALALLLGPEILERLEIEPDALFTAIQWDKGGGTDVDGQVHVTPDVPLALAAAG